MSSAQSSSVRALVERGESLAQLGWRIIDGHAHLGPYGEFHIPSPDASSMVAMMDRLGIDTTVFSPHLAISSDFGRGNDLAAEVVRRYPDRFAGYVTVNASYPGKVLPELLRGFDELGLCAIKLHPSLNGYSVSDPACEPIWRFAQERDAVVLSHTWEGNALCGPKLFSPLAGEYPGVRFLLGHSGGTTAGRQEAIEVVQAHDNVYLETCSSTLMSAELKWMVEEVSAERVIFGTDAPWLDPRFILGKVAYADLADEQFRLILGENMARLLGAD